MSLRGIFTGATIRAIAAIKDVGEIILADVGSVDGSAVNDVESRDIWTRVIQRLTGNPMMPRQYVPQNMLYRLPRNGEEGVVLRPSNVNGPGQSMFLYGACEFVPEWLAEDRSGISTSENIRIESRGADVEINADGIVNLQDGDKGVAREDDEVEVTIPSGTSIPGIGTTTGSLTVSGTITSSSSKVKAG